jgi:hypothetical protein
MHNQALAPVGLVSHFLGRDMGQGSVAGTVPAAFVPGRPKIQEMVDSDQSDQQTLAFKLMTAVINYDLSSEPAHRRISEAFDPDWQLFLSVARKNGLLLANEDILREPVQACSSRQFDEGKAITDAFAEAQGFWRSVGRESRETVFGANR